MKNPFEFLKVRATSIALVSMSCITLLLSVMLFYLIEPRIELNHSNKEAQHIVDKMVQTTQADTYVYWEVKLETNSRIPEGFAARNPADTAEMLGYLRKMSDVKLTAILDADSVIALISGVTKCEDSPGQPLYICRIPVRNHSEVLIGELTVVWHTKPTPEVENATIVQARSLLRVK